MFSKSRLGTISRSLEGSHKRKGTKLCQAVTWKPFNACFKYLTCIKILISCSTENGTYCDPKELLIKFFEMVAFHLSFYIGSSFNFKRVLISMERGTYSILYQLRSQLEQKASVSWSGSFAFITYHLRHPRAPLMIKIYTSLLLNCWAGPFYNCAHEECEIAAVC